MVVAVVVANGAGAAEHGSVMVQVDSTTSRISPGLKEVLGPVMD